MSYNTDWIRDLSAWRLRSMAEGDTYPDSEDSPGALFLKEVADTVATAMDSGDITYDSRYETHEGLYVAEGLYPGGPKAMGEVVLDLGAWSADYDCDSGDMIDHFRYALDRVAVSLAEILAQEAWVDDEDEDEEEDSEPEEVEEPVAAGVIPGLPWLTT